MGIKSNITDPATGQKAKVLSEGELLVSQYTCPPLLPQKNRVFRQYFTDDGTRSGSNDMLVDGSSRNVEFWIPAHSDNDRYITQISIVIGDGGANLNEFGGVSALTNGCKLHYEDTNGYEVVIHEALKSNWDFIRMCLINPAFGDAASAFRGTNVEGGAEAYMPVFDCTKIMPPYGIKLDRGTSQKIIFTIRDNCSQPDVFNVIAYGFERFP